MLRHDLNGVGDDGVPLTALIPSPLNVPAYGTPGYVPGATYIMPGSAYSMRSGERAKAQYGDVIEANVVNDKYTADELSGCECDGSGYGVGGSSMFRDNLGADDTSADFVGPAAPTTTQQAVQTARDIVTADVKIPSSFSTSTIIYAVGGIALAYLAYNYWYGRATA